MPAAASALVLTHSVWCPASLRATGRSGTMASSCCRVGRGNSSCLQPPPVSQAALLRSALAFHALDTPGEELRVVARMGAAGSEPVLTDQRTLDGEGIDDRPVVATVRIRSLAHGTPRPRWKDAPGDSRLPLEVGATRTILLTPDEAVSDRRRAPGLRGAYWHLRHVAERRYPFAYDRVRQVLLRRRIPLLAVVAVIGSTEESAVDPLAGVGTDHLDGGRDGDVRILVGLGRVAV